VNKGGDVF